jgi:outer membrane protein TolC
VNREISKLLDANLARVTKLRDDTKAMYDNGFVEKIDYDRTVLAYNNINTERENVNRLMQLSDLTLKFQMGMDITAPIILSDSLREEQVVNFVVSAEKPDVTQRVEYSLLQTQQHLMTLDLKRYKSQYIPGLYAYASYQNIAQRSQFDFTDPDGGWYPTGLIGATLSWNLFDGTQRERKIQQAKMNLQKTENDLINTSSALNVEAEASRTALINALASFNTQRENLALANDVVRVTKLKYDQGVGSNLEVIDSETSLHEAQTNYFRALYSALVAKVDLDKALGKIK